MAERNHEVVIDGYVFPDTVTVTLANDEYINSRDYVSKELYESVCGANDVWQSENAKLRLKLKEMAEIITVFADEYDEISERLEIGNHVVPVVSAYLSSLRELGVEVDG